MTRFDTSATFSKPRPTEIPPSVWVRTQLEGSDAYSLTIMKRTKRAQANKPSNNSNCAYAKLLLMESGAILATFPVMGMVSNTIGRMLGANWFELAVPLSLPDFVFGYHIEIPAGRHPLVFVLESWVVLFRPENTIRL